MVRDNNVMVITLAMTIMRRLSHIVKISKLAIYTSELVAPRLSTHVYRHTRTLRHSDNLTSNLHLFSLCTISA